MVSLTEPAVRRDDGGAGLGLVLAAASVLLVPAVLLGEVLTGGVRDGAVIALAAMTLGVLVPTRLAGLLGTRRRTAVQGRALRGAAAKLAATTDVDSVAATLRATVAELLPAGTPHRTAMVRGGADPPYSVSVGYVCTLAPSLAAELDDFELALACPLDAESGAAFYVAAGDEALLALRGAAETLAGQVAPALERIAARAAPDVVAQDEEAADARR